MAVERVAGLTGNVAIKAPCRVATTEEILLYGEQTIDGETVEAGQRVLVKDQTDARDNGIYVCSVGAWSRAPDFNGPRDVVRGTLVAIVDGDTSADVMYRVDEEATIGSTDIVFATVAPISGEISADAAAESAAEALASALAAASSATAAALSATAAANSAILASNRAAGIGAVPVGAMVFWLSEDVPDGWLEADGSLVLRTDWPDLYTWAGSRFGGNDGSTNFRLPDMRGEFPRGWDHGRGVDAGRALGSPQAESVGPHDHDATVSVSGSTNSAGGHSHTVPAVYDNVDGGGTAGSPIGAGASQIYKSGATTTSTDGAHSHSISITGSVTVANNDGTETRPRNVAGMWIIKAAGPSSILGIAWAAQTLDAVTQTANAKALATAAQAATLATVTQTATGTVTGP